MHLALIFILLMLAIFYGYLQGQSISASVVSTMISSRAVHPRTALGLAALGIALGPFVVGTAVAATIGEEFVRADRINPEVVIAGLTGAILWCGIAQWWSVPVSSSHALFGGLIGAAVAGAGSQVIIGQGLIKIFAGLLLSPLVGVLCGFMCVNAFYWLCRSAPPGINLWFQRGQVVVSLVMAVAFGSNEGQKLIGVMILGLVTTGVISHFFVPWWVVMFGAMAITAGALIGGWRLINTLGRKFYVIRPVHGFGAQMASTSVIFGAALAGWPVSGSQVVVSSIIGAGSADRLRKVRWGIVQQVALGWLLTLPVTAVISSLIYVVLKGLT